jgi:hypothetical protein
MCNIGHFLWYNILVQYYENSVILHTVLKGKVTRSHAFLAILKSKICFKNFLKINNEFLAKIQHYHSVRFCREKKMQVLLMLQIVFISLYCSHIYELCNAFNLFFLCCTPRWPNIVKNY